MLPIANYICLHYVPRNYQLRTWNCHGSFHSPLGVVPLLEPSMCLLLSFVRCIYTSKKGPFNKKENAFVVIMASAAANSALGTEVFAVQRLFYNATPNGAASIFLLFSSQLLGYGIGGLMRRAYINSVSWLCTPHD
jgi:hypothetical protein